MSDIIFIYLIGFFVTIMFCTSILQPSEQFEYKASIHISLLWFASVPLIAVFNVIRFIQIKAKK